MTHFKVLFHVDEMKKWPLVITNTRNLISELNHSLLDVEILANSVAIKYLMTNDHDDEKIEKLMELSKTVRFCACGNSLESLKIDSKDLFNFVVVVPSGVAELTIKQHEGYAYIKP